MRHLFLATVDLSVGGQISNPVGSQSPPVISPFAGDIDEPTVYSNALSQLQIQDIYAAGSAGKLPILGSNMMVAANVILAGDQTTNVIDRH